MGKYRVLSTKNLEPSLVEIAKRNDIEIIQQPFISVKPNSNEETINTILEIAKAKKAYIVLTSANAVHALSNYMAAYDGEVDWKLFCLSGKTKQAIQRVEFLKRNIIGEAERASALAKKIIESDVNEIVFFCGDKRRDELPSILKNAHIKVKEVIIYETLETGTKMDEHLDAILFFSPSGVQSFFSANKLPHYAICFAIGATTAAVIASFTNNETVVCSEPNPEAMMEQVIQHFKQKSAVN